QSNQELTIAQEELRRQNEMLVRARADVDSERARYESLFQFAPDGYIVTDLRGTILETNCSAAERFNIEPANLVGIELPSLVQVNDRRMFRARLRRLVESQSSDARANAVWELGIAPP